MVTDTAEISTALVTHLATQARLIRKGLAPVVAAALLNGVAATPSLQDGGEVLPNAKTDSPT